MPRTVMPVQTPEQNGPLSAELLGQFVRARRKQQGLAINDAALLCGVHVATLSSIENGKVSVKLETLLKVLNKLGIRLVIEPWD